VVWNYFKFDTIGTNSNLLKIHGWEIV
jgi:hypothetical protein